MEINLINQAPHYYGIAISGIHDVQTNGVYVINRGTDGLVDLEADAVMASIKANAIPHMKAGLYFAEYLLDTDYEKNILKSHIQYMGFAGHSLGGAIAQTQVIYFNGASQASVTLSPTKNFEPYGILGFVDGVNNFNCLSHLKFYNPFSIYDTMGHCIVEVATDVSKVTFSDELAIALTGAYQANHQRIANKIHNFYRSGDAISEAADIIGQNTRIPTPNSVGNVSRVNFLTLHSISNYTFQGYTMDGKLIAHQLNVPMSIIFKRYASVKDKSNFQAIFGAMSNYASVGM